MSFSARYVFAILPVILGLTVTVCAQSTTAQTSKTPKGSVSGRVTIKDRGAPGVAVGLRKSDSFTPYESIPRSITDHDGFYRITNVPAGTYFVAPAAPAFVLSDHRDPRGKSVIVGEDENVDDINFSLVRGGVVTGKITDADGRPVIQQDVNLFQADAFNQSREPDRAVFPMRNAQTDDRGIYRMYGLTAGRYKLAVGRSEGTFMGNIMPGRKTFKQVFHPDVTDHTKALVIEVSEGSEAKDIDIKLGPAIQTYSVSGRVIDAEKGLPVPNVRFGLQRAAGQRTEFVNTSLASNDAGDFLAEGLIPGTYSIFMFQNVSTEMRADSFSFEIVDHDVTDLTIKLSRGASLSGVVVLETQDKAASQKLLEMQLRAFVRTAPPSGIGQSSISPIAADGSFRLQGLPAGTASMSLGSPMGPPFVKGYMISRIERDGVVNPSGVEVKEGEQVTGLRVYVAFGNATVRGVVKLENGSLPPGMQLFVRVAKAGERLSNLPPVQVDARGHFVIEGIPPGQYDILVTVPGAKGTPPRQVKQEVSAQNGVVTDVMFTIDLSLPSPPMP